MQNYNLIIDIKDMEAGSPSISEPVSVPEFKIYARLESFEDDLGSTANLPFTQEDSLIQELIISARESIEKYTNRALIPKELRVVVTNLAGMIELPLAPIGDITALYYGWDFQENGESATNNVDDLDIVGSDRKYIESPCDCKMVIDYSCGYDRGDTMRLPRRLKMAILAETLFRFEHRGEEGDGLCKAAQRLADPFVIRPLLT